MAVLHVIVCVLVLWLIWSFLPFWAALVLTVLAVASFLGYL